jgi:hypothetical protein
MSQIPTDSPTAIDDADLAKARDDMMKDVTALGDAAKAITRTPADGAASRPKRRNDEECPPCKTRSGRIVPVGTIAYRPLDTPPAGKIEHGIAGPHYNIYKANQSPRSSPQPCRCFWQPVGAVPPSALPTGAIPIESFVN